MRILDGYWNPPREPVLLPGKQMLVNPSGPLLEALPEHFYTFSLPGPHGFFPRVSIVDGKLKVEPDDDADVEAAIDQRVRRDPSFLDFLKAIRKLGRRIRK